MKRRAFMTLLGGAAAGWPLAARAQQAGMVRRKVRKLDAPGVEESARSEFVRPKERNHG